MKTVAKPHHASNSYPFLSALYSKLDGLIELRAITTGKSIQCKFVSLADGAMLERLIHAHRDENVFFGVATRKDASKGTLANCAWLPALFVDIDYKHTPEAEARQRLSSFACPPSAVVSSGGGLHVYWLLRMPLDLQAPTNCAIARSILGRLATSVGGDLAAAEPARVLRVPGTWNQKYTPPREVIIERLQPTHRYSLESFEAQIAPEAAALTSAQFKVLETIPDGQRNTTLYKTARSLKAKGLTSKAITAAIHEENAAKCLPPLPTEEVDRISRHAWTQPDRPEFARPRLPVLLARLRGMSPEDIKVTWIALSEGLNAGTERALMAEVQHLTGLRLDTLKKALAEYKSSVQKKALMDRTGLRLTIEYHPENVSMMAEIAERATLSQAAEGELIDFAGVLARVVIQAMPWAHQADSDQVPVPTAQIDILNKPKLRPLIERAVVFQKTSEHRVTNIEVPDKVLEHILVNATHVPKVSALITHPVVTRSGRIVSTIGIDQETGLLIYGNPVDGLRPYSQAEAVEAVNTIADLFTEGFEFSTLLDRACALGMLLTGLMRKMLDTSPGVLITAAQQSVGKTTLARRTHLILTGRDMPVMTWPEGNEAETNKLVFSALLGSPPLLCFDNVGDGLTFRSPALAAMMTSPVKEERILGLSRVAKVPTTTLFVLTGNNLALSNDEVHRWMRIHLNSSHISPHKRTFTHPDVVGHALQIREILLRHAIGIIAGYMHDSEKIACLSRFPQWDAMVRQPLVWAGLQDIAKAFDANIEASPELGALSALLTGLSYLFGNKEFSASELISLNGMEKPQVINEALRALHAKDTENDRSVGHALAKVCGRAVVIGSTSGDRIFHLERRLVSGLTRYRVSKGLPPMVVD